MSRSGSNARASASSVDDAEVAPADEGRAQASRRKILEAAREVFFESGFDRANLDEVARRAGIAKGTIYRYFDTKAELYVAVLLRNADQFVGRMRAAVDTDLPVEAQLRAIGRFYFEHYTHRNAYFQIFWAIDNQPLIGELPPGLLGQVEDVWRRSLVILSEVIELGVERGELAACDPWETANVLWMMANAVIRAEEVPERRALWPADARHKFDSAVEILLAGMRAPERR